MSQQGNTSMVRVACTGHETQPVLSTINAESVRPKMGKKQLDSFFTG